MERKKRHAAFWVKGLGWLLAVMLLFTVMSRAATALTIAKVSVSRPSARKLQYIVTAEGRVEKNREISVLTQPDMRVKSVLVSEGQRVKKDEILAVFDMECLEERIDSIKDEKKVLQLQNKAAPAGDSSIEINKISMKNLDKQLDSLYALKKQKGQVKAPKDGVITAVLVGVGQKTTEMDAGAFTMTDDSAGLKFAGMMMAEDAKYVSTGDTVTLHTANKEENVSVTSMKMDESGEFINITALLPPKTFSLGEKASIRVVQESEKYPCTIPVTAVYQNNGKYYILLLQTESTVLGEQETVRKMEVKVLEQNGTYAALEADALDSESLIITDSDRFVEAGDRVRLLDE